MPIKYHENGKVFHLYNGTISYVIQITENKKLSTVYFGRKLMDRVGLESILENWNPSTGGWPVAIPEPGTLMMHKTPLEYPEYGTGDFRSPAISIKSGDGSYVTDFQYQNFEIFAGKKDLGVMPATYVGESGEATTIEFKLEDACIGSRLILSYTIFEEYPVITRNVRVEHDGEDSIVIYKIMSSSMDFSDSNFEIIDLNSAWARECNVSREKLKTGVYAIQNLTGTCSSAIFNPFAALVRKETTEYDGEAYGFSLVYSGNFLIQSEVSNYNMTRIMTGIHPQNFEWELKKGESFETPETVIVYSKDGLNGMSQVYHDLYRRHLCRGYWRDKERPILLNNWEATYFDFDEEKLLLLADKAVEIGCELFVLDDGWFGNRDDDTKGLGDWICNNKKIPDGIGKLSKKIKDKGLMFGLWIEPEMINKNSHLYETHPEWLIGNPDRFLSHSRHQYVLDFTKQEVIDYMEKQLCEILDNSEVDYIKWDMNRFMTEPYSNGAVRQKQGKIFHEYILGVYTLYKKLTEKYPKILFESCASGGMRFDPGMLYYAPQTWCSDNTDSYERMKIQYGTSYVYPLSSIDANVSASPNHQMGRKTPLASRANVAYFGTFGYTLDPMKLAEDEIEEIKHQVLFMKEYRKLIQMNGKFYRLINPYEYLDGGWMVVSSDGTQGLVMYYQCLHKINTARTRIALQGLIQQKQYHLIIHYAEESRTYDAFGDELMYVGVTISEDELRKAGGDFGSVLIEIEAV